MNYFAICSAAMGPACLLGVYLVRKSNSWHDFTHINHETEALIEMVSWSYDPPSSNGTTIPNKDVILIYLQSRGNRDWANKMRLENPGNREFLFLLDKLSSDHNCIKKLALACILGRPVDRLDGNCSSVRHKRLLWTYADELAVLNQLTDFCAPHDRHFIAARM